MTADFSKLKELFATNRAELADPVPPVETQKKLTATARELLSDFRAVRDKDDSAAIIQLLSATTCRQRSFEGAVNELATRLDKYGVIIMHKDIQAAVKTWLMTAPKLDKMPPSFSIDPTELSFNHFDISQLADGPTPYFDDFIKRSGENGPALMAWVWSLFTGAAHSQYIALHGQGGDGKSSFIEVLEKIFEGAVGLIEPTDTRWPVQLVGKRLAVIPELNNTAFPNTAQFKAVTGNDLILVDQKNVSAYYTKLDCKIILASNKGLQIGSGKSERRRIIAINIESPEVKLPNYKNTLWAERYFFLYKCREKYNKLYSPSEEAITGVDYSAYELHSSSSEEHFELLWEKKFVPASEKDRISATSFYDAVKDELRNNTFEVNEFKRYVERTHKVKHKRIQENGQRAAYYYGLELRGPAHMNKVKILKGDN